MSLDWVMRTKPPYKLYLKDKDNEFHLIDSIFPVAGQWVVLLKKTGQQVTVFEKSEEGEGE